MKKYTAAEIQSASLPAFTTDHLPRYTRRKSKKILMPPPSPPDEETINKLNGIGHEYPFCVYYKEKNNDPL